MHLETEPRSGCAVYVEAPPTGPIASEQSDSSSGETDTTPSYGNRLPPTVGEDGSSPSGSDRHIDPRYERYDPQKRPHSVDAEELFRVRKRLFYDCLERPTKDVFFMEGERIDMNDPATCELQRALFARVYNSMSNFSKSDIADKNLTLQQNLRWSAALTTNRLRKLSDNAYRDYHLDVTSAVSYILRALEDIKHIRREEIVFQLVPMTCTIDQTVRERLRVNNLEVRQVNNSRSLSVNLNTDVKFLYAGTMRSKGTPDQGEKFYVAPTQCMGAYMHDAVSELYDLIYERTTEYIGNFYRRYPDGCLDAFPTVTNAFNETDTRTVYGKQPVAQPAVANDRTTLNYLLRTVGRDVNLRKVDLDKIEVFVLTSAAKSKPKYLNAKTDRECRIECLPVADTEAVFLSSYTRARIMEDGSLYFQIYSRACVYLSDDQRFPEGAE